MVGGEIQYRDDASSSGTNYWGNNMFWNNSSPGWIMIIDDHGEIVDYLPWGWTDAEIQGFSATINGFNHIFGILFFRTGSR